jgi:hypothetical protein
MAAEVIELHTPMATNHLIALLLFTSTLSKSANPQKD